VTQRHLYTANSVRAIPVHPKLAEVVQPVDAKASALSVRFGRLMRDAKLPKGKTFHSLRKRFATALERLECPEGMAVRLLGHKPNSLTYSVYSEGRHVAEMKEWIDRVTQPV
jgi:integrase